MSKCCFCGTGSIAGASCHKSPSGGHVIMKAGRCSYCGTGSIAGASCHKSPSGGHIIGVWQ